MLAAAAAIVSGYTLPSAARTHPSCRRVGPVRLCEPPEDDADDDAMPDGIQCSEGRIVTELKDVDGELPGVPPLRVRALPVLTVCCAACCKACVVATLSCPFVHAVRAASLLCA